MALLQKAYLGATPLFRNVPWFHEFNGVEVTALNNSTVTLTAGATAHTKGSWVQLIASTSGDSNLFSSLWQGSAAASTDTATVMDIGIGASGSEVVVAADIAVGGYGAALIQLPISIPSGSRIAARIAGVRGSSQTIVTFGNLYVFNIPTTNSSLLPSSVDVLGVDTATSTGTAMSGASGTWVEVVASTSDDYIAFSIIPSLSDDTATSINDLRMTLGVGASGSEVVIGEISSSANTSEQIATRTPTAANNLFGREVPAGSRLAIKHNIGTSPDKYDACIIAVPKP